MKFLVFHAPSYKAGNLADKQVVFVGPYLNS